MLTRRTPLKPGSTQMKRTPMKRTSSLDRRSAIQARAEEAKEMPRADLRRKPIKRKAPKRRPMEQRRYALACKGETCYLLIPGAPSHDLDTVVDCHSNQQAHGKGMGIKADDEKTVPGCGWCHHAIDQGNWLTKEERRNYWDDAYRRWVPVRAVKLALHAPEMLEAA